jgi:hypothetical protein
MIETRITTLYWLHRLRTSARLMASRSRRKRTISLGYDIRLRVLVVLATLKSKEYHLPI